GFDVSSFEAFSGAADRAAFGRKVYWCEEGAIALLNRLERASRRAGSYRWYALGITTFCQSAAVSLTNAVGPLAPLLQQDFQISRAEIGLVLTSMSASSAVVALIGGRAADQVGERRVLIVSGLIASLAALSIAQAGLFWWFLAFCFLLGLGSGIQN